MSLCRRAATFASMFFFIIAGTMSTTIAEECRLTAKVAKTTADGPVGATDVGPWKVSEHHGTWLTLQCGSGEPIGIFARKTKNKDDCERGTYYMGVNKPDVHGGHCVWMEEPGIRMQVKQTSTKNCESYRDYTSAVYVGPAKASEHYGTCV